MIIDRIGEKFTTNEGYEVEIIEYIGSKNYTIRFNNGYIAKNIRYDYIQKGTIKNPYHKSVFNVGYYGIGRHKSSLNGKATGVYMAWYNMMKRCYDPKFQAKWPTYIGCTVNEDFHCFQDFAEWCEGKYIDGYCLDKDWLIFNNKIYGKNTCCFIPEEINLLLNNSLKSRGNLPIGVWQNGNNFSSSLSINRKKIHLGTFKTIEEAFNVYKIEREKYVKDLANKYKNVISKELYISMNNYKININD